MNIASALGNKGQARWSLRLLGDVQLSELASGEKVALPGKRERVLLAYLALSPNGRQPRRKLVTLLWGETADEASLENLRTSIFNLRKSLGDTEHQVVASEDRDVVLDTAAFEVDVLEFRALAAGPMAELEEAAKLYAGEFLDGLSIESEEFESWRREEFVRCKGQVLDVLTRLMALFAASGESERAVETGLQILRLEPLHEGAVRRLMRLYAESGRRATAVGLYRTLAESLKKELGAQPEAETRALYAEITRGEVERTPEPADAKAPPPPANMAAATAAVREPSPANPTRYPRTRTIGWIAAGGLAAAAIAVILLLVPFAPSTDPASRPATVVAATSTSAIALAVLPFVNLSTEPDQEFFSDGLTDEITSALARVPDLRIVARTSAFEFKGQNRNIRTIGEQLGATHLIEGSVRKDGNRLRITAQLIEAQTGVNVWTESYDRELSDVFALQEDIARAIAASLRMPLGLQPGENLVTNRGIDPESYQQFLRAKALVLQRRAAFAQAIAILEPLVARNPNFAPGWAQLALIYQRIPGGDFRPGNVTVEETRRAADEWLPKAEAAAERAVALDASLPDGYSSLGLTMAFRGRLLQADASFKRALALDPFYPEALHSYANFLGAVGYAKEALAMREQLRSIEPLVPVYNLNRHVLLLVTGQTDTAIASIRAAPRRESIGEATLPALIHAAEGRYADALDDLRAIPQGRYPDEMMETAVRLLRAAPTRPASLQSLPRLGPELHFVYLHIGAPERVLDAFEDGVAAGFLPPSDLNSLWLPSYAPARKLEQFKAFARSYGLVDYWRVKGWPDLCRPAGADDFTCD